MPSTFFGLEIGRRALTSSQLALDVIGQNTANVNTPGYSRQVVAFEATDPFTPPDFQHLRPGQLGTGVNIASINRIRDAFLDHTIYNANSQQGALNNLRDILSRVENAYNEPSDTGLSSQLTGFFNAFGDLSTSPESGAIRATVLNKAQTLIASFHSLSTTLSQLGPEINARIASKIGDVNDIATQVAALNKQIRIAQAGGDHPNDLLDKRGALLNQLSGLVDIQIVDEQNSQTNQPTGQVQVNVGGYSLVAGDSANPLPSTPTSTGNTPGLVTALQNTIPLKGGEIYGLIKASTLVTGYQTDLNTLASNLITAFNAQHQAGYDLNGAQGTAFFTGSTAASIAVSGSIQTDLNKIAAAAVSATGNGDNARALAQFVSRKVIGDFTLDEYYNAKVATVGADSQSAQTASDSQDKVVNMLNNQQASVSGVSIDEEMTRMLQYQRSYQAAARIINMQDDVLNRIINGLGVAAGTGG